MNITVKKKLGIFSLTCCEGCEFEMLNHFASFKKLLDFYEVDNFRIGQQDNLPGPFDVAIIDGNPEGEEQVKLLREIRKRSDILVTIGACANLGGIQSERNRLPKKLIAKDKVRVVADVVKVDYFVPGCPINHAELYKCLMDLFWGKNFALPDLAVCFECRQNQNVCLLKLNKPCLGPITRAGCDAICIDNGEACLGCRGSIPQPNILKLRELLGTMISENEIEDMMTIYGNIEKNNV